MEKNSLLISGYVQLKNGNVYRQYYMKYENVYVPISFSTNLEWVRNVYKNVPTYKDTDLKKVIKGELKIDDLKTCSYREFIELYAGV